MPLQRNDENAEWRKATYSIGNGECVEVALLAGGVAVRDSGDPHGLVLRYSAESWRSFIAREKNKKNYRNKENYRLAG